MRASRLLSILMTLQARGRVTAQALADSFEVSVRTIYRDIDHLSAAGVPVYAEKGPGGGFALLDGYRTRLTGFTAPEAETLLLAGLPGAAEQLGLADALASARLKLLAALPASAVQDAQRVGDRFHLDPADWYRQPSKPEFLARVAGAVWRQQVIEIVYASWSAQVARRVRPLGLVMKAGVWYLVAEAAEAFRTYRLDKLLACEVLEEGFERPPAFNLAAHWAAETARFEASLWRGEATVRVSSAGLSRLSRLGSRMEAAILAAEPDEQGWRLATVPIEGVEHAAGILLQLGDAVQVLSPTPLRRAMARIARKVLDLHAEPPAD